MTISNEQIDVVVARMAAAFPQTFVLEKHLPHRPLKVGVAADLRAALPDLPRAVLGRALAAYTKRIMYLQALTARAPRVDLAGNPAGGVTALEASYASAVLAGIMAVREVSPRRKKTGEVPIGASPKQPPAVIAAAASSIQPAPAAEIVAAPLPAPEPAKRLAGLSDLREAAKRRKAAMA
jgi:sRNA-binding protein